MKDGHKIVKAEVISDEVTLTLASGVVVHLASRTTHVHMSFSNIADLKESGEGLGLRVGHRLDGCHYYSNNFDIEYLPKGDK